MFWGLGYRRHEGQAFLDDEDNVRIQMKTGILPPAFDYDIRYRLHRELMFLAGESLLRPTPRPDSPYTGMCI